MGQRHGFLLTQYSYMGSEEGCREPPDTKIAK